MLNSQRKRLLLLLCIAEAEGWLDEPHSRRYWVHPSHDSQRREEAFKEFYTEIRKKEDTFVEYFRMSIKSFDELLDILRPHIAKKNTFLRKSISVEVRLTVTLRYLSTGKSYNEIQKEFNISDNTISHIVSDTCGAICTVVKPVEIPKVTQHDQWYKIAEKFNKKTNFPNCVGSVFGKNIGCVKPNKSGSKFCNFKNVFSAALIAVVDADLNFIAVDVVTYDQKGDSSVFRDSPFCEELYSGEMNLPPPRILPNTDSSPQPFVFVCGLAFTNHSNLLLPFPQDQLDPRKRVFNYRLSRCRRTAECVFSILSDKWHVFNAPLMVNPDKIDVIVKACCTLYNFIKKRDSLNYDLIAAHTFTDISNLPESLGASGLEVREFFADYFMGPGAVTFQRHFM